MNCEFNGDISSFNELNEYIDFFESKGMLNKNTGSITTLALLTHSDKSKDIIGIDIKCVSRSVNGYLTYLRNIGDLDKSINHFFELKQKINEPKMDITNMIDPNMFSNPLKVASYIKFIVVNEINYMFGLDYYNPEKTPQTNNTFLTCREYLNKHSTKYSNIHDVIDSYYLYLIKTYNCYYEYYVLYDYLLCYAHHLETFGKSLVKKQKGGKRKNTKYRCKNKKSTFE
jgi:hypothetical protein